MAKLELLHGYGPGVLLWALISAGRLRDLSWHTRDTFVDIYRLASQCPLERLHVELDYSTLAAAQEQVILCFCVRQKPWMRYFAPISVFIT